MRKDVYQVLPPGPRAPGRSLNPASGPALPGSQALWGQILGGCPLLPAEERAL